MSGAGKKGDAQDRRAGLLASLLLVQAQNVEHIAEHGDGLTGNQRSVLFSAAKLLRRSAAQQPILARLERLGRRAARAATLLQVAAVVNPGDKP